MSALTPASEVILRHSDEFIARHVLFAGDLQDALPAQFDAAGVRVHTNQYHHWQLLSNTLEENVQFGLLATAETLAACDTLIYYWPKSKQEAQFQLANLLSILPVGTDILLWVKPQWCTQRRRNVGRLRAVSQDRQRSPLWFVPWPFRQTTRI